MRAGLALHNSLILSSKAQSLEADVITCDSSLFLQIRANIEYWFLKWEFWRGKLGLVGQIYEFLKIKELCLHCLSSVSVLVFCILMVIITYFCRMDKCWKPVLQFWVFFFFFRTNQENSPGWYGSVNWVLAWKPKGCWFDSHSFLRARSPVGVCKRHPHIDVSLPLFLPPFPSL